VKGVTELLQLRDFHKNAGRAAHVQALVDRMFKIRRPLGSFGAYTVSSLFTVAALRVCSPSHPHPSLALSLLLHRSVAPAFPVWPCPVPSGG